MLANRALIDPPATVGAGTQGAFEMSGDVLVERDSLVGDVAVMPPFCEILLAPVVNTIVEAIEEGRIIEEKPEVGEVGRHVAGKVSQIFCSSVSNILRRCTFEELYRLAKQPCQRIAEVQRRQQD